MRLTFCVRCPSEEVGLAAGRGLVAVVEGGYRADSFFEGSVCLTDAVRPRPPGLTLLLVLDDVDVDVDMLRVGGFTGRRLGEPWRGSEAVLVWVLVLLVVEDVELGFLRERERARDVDMAAVPDGSGNGNGNGNGDEAGRVQVGWYYIQGCLLPNNY
jgi:hypothetical protein